MTEKATAVGRAAPFVAEVCASSTLPPLTSSCSLVDTPLLNVACPFHPLRGQALLGARGAPGILAKALRHTPEKEEVICYGIRGQET